MASSYRFIPAGHPKKSAGRSGQSPGPASQLPSRRFPAEVCPVQWLEKLKTWFAGRPAQPEHLRRGELGESAAKKFLQQHGLVFLTANFRSARGEIDLVFRDHKDLVFVEVKTRSSEAWSRPAAAVNARKRRLLSLTALDYLQQLNHPPVKFRFDIVEVLLREGAVREVRHLPNVFPLAGPYRYGGWTKD